MKKIILTSILCLMAFLGSFADGYKYYLNVKFTGDGSAYLSIPLSKMPVMTYQHDNDQDTDVLVLTTNDGAESMHIFDLSNNYTIYYTAENTPSSITSAISNSAFSKSGEIVTINGLNANETVSVYSVNGVKAADVVADANGVAVIDLTALPKGVIVMKSLATSIKIAH